MLNNIIYKKLYRKSIRSSAQKKHMHTVLLDKRSDRHIQIMAALFFVGFALIIAYGYKTLLTWNEIIQLFIVLAVVFSLIPRIWLPLIYRIRKELKVLLASCALAPFFTGLILMLNFYIGELESKQTIKIINYKFRSSEQIVIIELENSELNKHVEIRKFSLTTLTSEPDSAVFLIHKGIFGINTVNDSWLISKK